MKQFILSSIIVLTACTNNKVEAPISEATVTMGFIHLNKNVALELDNIIYTNALDQAYSIKTVKYFVSKITFLHEDGTKYIAPDIHYVDIRNSETLQLELSKTIPFGKYSKISFVYGLEPEDNVTGSLGIELDRLMEWPAPMGGGYHYMKLEGEYVANNETNFFNFHAGSLANKAYEIYVDLPNSGFEINSNTLSIDLKMEVNNWFQNPTDWDFAYWGSGIMGNADAQSTVQQNGVDVFTIEISDKEI